jgi:hypothetical protein
MPTPNKPGSTPRASSSGASRSGPKPGSKPGSKPTKASAAKSPAASGVPPKRKASTSIVDKPQRPWGLIATTAVVVIFALAIVGYAVTRSGGGGDTKAGGGASVAPATATAAEISAIQGVTSKTFAGGNHSTSVIDYGADSPPFGGEHNPVWADCTGTVYPNALANENAVHTLEHGAVWITYKPGLDQASIDKLAKRVNGINFMIMSPYAGLKTDISLQAWGYQLFVDSADDPRIDEFISKVRLNPNTTPEYGATCSQPAFKASESTPGHPFSG